MKLALKKKIDLHNCTLLEACFVYTGGNYIRAAKLHTFIASWRIVTEELGRNPSQLDYCDYWNVSRSSLTRDLRMFRAAFTKLDTPNDLPAAVAELVEGDYFAAGVGT